MHYWFIFNFDTCLIFYKQSIICSVLSYKFNIFWQIGKTKVFLRAGQMAELDALRTEILGRSASIIQRKVRSYLARRSFVLLRRSAIHLQSACRGNRLSSTHFCIAGPTFIRSPLWLGNNYWVLIFVGFRTTHTTSIWGHAERGFFYNDSKEFADASLQESLRRKILFSCFYSNWNAWNGCSKWATLQKAV